jgi:hypothetical protein
MRSCMSALFAVLAISTVSASAFGQATVEQELTCISSDDTSIAYAARVTTNYDFELNLKVYKGSTLKHSTLQYIVNDGPSYTYRETIDCSTWALAVGDKILFRVKATIMEGPYQGTYATDNDTVTVCAPGTCALPQRRNELGAWA